MTIGGDCWNDRLSSQYFVMYEKYESTCNVTVRLTGSKQRTVVLQYWDDDDGQWYEEARKTTKKLKATLRFSSICYGEYGEEYCDGEFEYRVVVLASTRPRLREIRSRSFFVQMVPINGYYE